MNSVSNNQNSIRSLVKTGGGDMKILQSYLALIILGYFTIKIIYGGFFKFYPDKYYYRNVDINTNEKDSNDKTEKVTMNAFMPGLWNNEITDFVSCIILLGITYVFANIQSRKMFDVNGMVDSTLIIGYVIGLLFPIFYQGMKDNCRLNLKDQCTQHNMGILVISLIMIGVLLFINMKSSGQDSKNSTFIYVMAIVLLIIGLYYTRKMSKTYVQVNYYKSKDTKCSMKNTGYVFTSGDQMLITPAFASWILLFFFVIEPQNEGLKKFINFVFGLLLGIFVSSMSYYGIDYFLIKVGEKSCSSPDECKLVDMPRPPEDTKTTDVTISESGRVTIRDIFKFPHLNKRGYLTDFSGLSGVGDVKKNIVLERFKVFLIILIVLMLVFLLYKYMQQQKK
jgi:hypothetical protein